MYPDTIQALESSTNYEIVELAVLGFILVRFWRRATVEPTTAKMCVKGIIFPRILFDWKGIWGSILWRINSHIGLGMVDKPGLQRKTESEEISAKYLMPGWLSGPLKRIVVALLLWMCFDGASVYHLLLWYSFDHYGCCGFFGLFGRVLKVVLPDVSPVSVAGIFRGLE